VDAPGVSVPIPPKPHPDAVRCVALSDTHEKHRDIKDIPEGDILLHAGDFTLHGVKEKVLDFNDFLGTLPHPHKVVIAGNHDLFFEEGYYDKHWQEWKKILGEKKIENFSSQDAKALLTNCTYVEDQAVEIMGLKIYGSPWSPAFGGWAFGYPEGREKWTKIPENTDILMTHGPPKGILDKNMFGSSCGCSNLMVRLVKLKPLVHVFGHVHETYGVEVPPGMSTVFINGSNCNTKYKANNKPIVFDVL